MRTRHVFILAALTLLLVFALSAGWEFVLEGAVMNFLALDQEPESNALRWEFVITATVFTAIAVSLSTPLALTVAAGHARAQKALRNSEARLAGILNIATEAVISTDESQCIELFNQGAEAIFGYSADEVLGRPLEMLLPPRFAQMHGKNMADFANAPEISRVMNRRPEILGLRKDGTEFPAEATISKLQLGDRTIFTVMLQDITERMQARESIRRSEELLSDALENIADGVVLFDAGDRVVIWNRKFADMYPELAQMLPGRPTAEEMFRERIRAGAVGDFGVPVEEYVAWRMEQRKKLGGTPATHRHRDGRWSRTTERRTSDGGIVSISTDITELKNREAELDEAKELADLANRAKSEFLASMSHELRTPLNAVIGFSEIMQSEALGPVGNAKYREYANDIHDAGSHLLMLINDILDLAKVEAGEEELHEEDIDVVDAIESAIRMVHQHAVGSGLRIETEIPRNSPPLHADPRKVKQILANLLSNAVKFTPAGTITVKAWWRAEGGYVFQIVDTGVGIALEDIPKALSHFGQVGGTLNREHDGTGLGLPLAKSLVELHGGSLDLQSEVGTGTTVTVRFPAERGAAAATDAPPRHG